MTGPRSLARAGVVGRFRHAATRHVAARTAMAAPAPMHREAVALRAIALAVKAVEWQQEMASASEFFDKIGQALPAALRDRHQELSAALAHDSMRKAG